MIDVRETHRQAMEKADQAVAAQKAGDLEAARALFREACTLESEAAHALVDKPEAEPTRSVLFRSAASLAIEAQQSPQAAYLVACGLEGSPPEEIREELRDLLRRVRPQVEPDRADRFLSSCASLQAAANRLRMALADRSLMGRALSGSVTQDVLDMAQESLRTFTGDASLSVDLFGIGDPGVSKWVSVSPREPMSGWFQFAKVFVLEHGDRLLQAKSIVGQVEELARAGTLPEDCLRLAQDVGVRALATNPVRAIGEGDTDRPAFVLLALASQHTAFVDGLACQILSQTAALLGIAVQIGWRDESFAIRGDSPPGIS